MFRTFTDLARNTLGQIYPSVCLICDTVGGQTAAFRHGLCTECHRAVTADPFSCCPRCAQTVGPYSDTENGCVECRGAKFRFDRAVRLGPYERQLRDAVL